MAAATPVSQGTAGFVVPGASVYGAGSTASTTTNNLRSDVDTHYSNRNGLKFSIFFFAGITNATGDAWASAIPGIVALAWQGADATDDAGVPILTSPSAGTIQFEMENASAAGWLWVLHGS